MEELAGINFLCVMEGQDYERALSKIVSKMFYFLYITSNRSILKKLPFNIPNKFQGFSKYHFTPLEVLIVIEGIQKHLDRQFTPEEIENGILKDLIIEEDYDLIRVVTIYSAFERAS